MTVQNRNNSVDVRDYYNRTLNTSSEQKRIRFEEQVLSDLEELKQMVAAIAANLTPPSP